MARRLSFLLGNTWITSILVFLVGSAGLALVTEAWGPAKPLVSDAAQYLSIGQSLAAGNGYRNAVSPWPDRPDYARMPGWPLLISLGLQLAPRANSDAVSRFTNAFCLASAGAFFCSLSLRLGVRPGFAFLSGVAVCFSPVLVFLSVDGLSEVSFVMIVALGLTLTLFGGRRIYPGALLLGTAALVRTNFVLVPFGFLGVALLFRTSRHLMFRRIAFPRICAACAIALIPAFLWTVRNYRMSGRFPLLSTLEGETFYGANNPVAANSLEFWGYWVFPDTIPGEVPKLELAQRLGNDLALNDYYHRKGITWIEQNWRSLPRLELGKFIRAFVPIPWKPLTPIYLVFFCRSVLYVLWLALSPFWWPLMNRTYLLFCLAMALVHVITTAIYYGLYRFTHCYVEVFFIPCIVLGLQAWMDSKADKRLASLSNRSECESRF